MTIQPLPLEVDVPVPPNHYLPDGFDVGDVEQVRRLARGLLDRPVESSEELATWIAHWGELWTAVDDGGTRRNVSYDRDTSNQTAQAEHTRYQREVNTPWLELDDALNRRLLASPWLDGLGEEYAPLVRQRRETAALFRSENLPRIEREQELSKQWVKLQGAMAVELFGETLTTEQCEALGFSHDRAKREAAYRALAARRAVDRAAVDDILGELVKLRHEVATCAGCEDYVQYRFRELHRFDYTPADCDAFADAVERHVVPLMLELRAERAKKLGLDRLRPWDARVNVHTDDDSALFGTEEEYIELGAQLFQEVSPALAEHFDVLRRNHLLDLTSRPNKSPGGYCAPLGGIRLPFLFINAVGTARDVMILLHEGGHGFHAIESREREPAAYRECGAEFAEVASMAMELFGMEAYPAVLPAARARALALENLEDLVLGLARVAQVDVFQRWMYTHPGHTPAERRAAWTDATRRYFGGVDWTGLEDACANDWQRVPHFFGWPLYFIEYGIARLGSLQVWRNARRDKQAAVDAYRHALSLGGSRPLPELFQAAGARFGLDEPLVGELTSELRASLAKLEGAPAR